MIASIGAAKVDVSDGMIELAARMEEVAAMIRRGEISACSMCYVESGPDKNVCTDWAAMYSRITMVGGLFRLMTLVSDS